MNANDSIASQAGSLALFVGRLGVVDDCVKRGALGGKLRHRLGTLYFTIDKCKFRHVSLSS